MTSGAYILLQNPLTNGYPYLESINSCLDIFDEILIVDGGTNDGSFDLLPKDNRIRILTREWADDADWDFMMEQFDYGLQNLNTDWRVRVNGDYVFHDKNIDEIKRLFQQNVVGYTFLKNCFSLVDRFRTKVKATLAVNKKLNPGVFYSKEDKLQCGDKVFTTDDFNASGIPVYVYDHIFQNREQFGKIMFKLAKLAKNAGKAEWGSSSLEDATNFVIEASRSRIASHPQDIIALNEHPKYIQQKIKDMNDTMLGYSLYGQLKANYFN